MPVPYRQQNGGHHLRATLALAGLIALVLGLAFAALTPQVGVEQATRETARAPKQAPPGDKTLEKTVDKTKDDFWARHSYQDIARAKAPFFRAEKDGSLRCNSRVIGAILKDSGGLPTRATLDKEATRPSVPDGGALLGDLARDAFGRPVNAIDEFCLSRALEHAKDGSSVRWSNADSGVNYDVTPTRTYKQSSGRFCRIFAIQALIQGQAVRRFATACRQPRGAWSKLG